MKTLTGASLELPPKLYLPLLDQNSDSLLLYIVIINKQHKSNTLTLSSILEVFGVHHKLVQPV